MDGKQLRITNCELRIVESPRGNMIWIGPGGMAVGSARTNSFPSIPLCPAILLKTTRKEAHP